MKVRYVGPRPRDVAPVTAGPFHVRPGQVVEVDAKTGRSLLRQNSLFEPVTETKKKETDNGDA
jgi:hypothetical protein